MTETTNPHAEPAMRPAAASSWLWNKDLAPIPRNQRTWGTYNYAALWVAMSVNIPTYMLASAMIAGGMNWKQAIFTVFLGNIIVLVPMLLNAHAGAAYGIPFPVFARASFGVLGANVPAVLRALVACGWFGIQTWIGGEAINTLLAAMIPGLGPRLAVFHPVLAAESRRYSCAASKPSVSCKGITAPALLILGLAMLGWAYTKAGGLGPMLSTPSQVSHLQRIFRVLHSVAHRCSSLLGHGRAEYSGFHALRQEASANRC